MLTAAYVEQLFNKEGQGTDAIQNVAFDVVSEIEIQYEQHLSGRKRKLWGEEWPGGDKNDNRRELRLGGIIMAFTMTLKYRTYSANIDPSTAAAAATTTATARGPKPHLSRTETARGQGPEVQNG